MVSTTKPKMRPMPEELLKAIDEGPLTQEQLRELITYEAEALGLTFDEAVRAAKRDKLPKTPIGLDIRSLVSMLV